MESVRRAFDALRSAGTLGWISLGAAVLLLYAYANLFTLGKRYSLASGIEYWLFRPTDNAPAVVLVLTGWLVYRRFYRLRALRQTTAPMVWLVPMMAVAIGFQAWAAYTRADDLQVPSLILALSALLMVRWGPSGVRALLLPLAFLLFAIPIPAPLLLAIVFKLQIWTAEFAGWLLYALGSPALVSGDQILRATQTFQVIEGCSGMRSMITLAMLTVLMIDLFGRRGWHAGLLLAAVIPVAFVLNGFRVLTLILNPHSEIVAIHNLQGIAILLAGVLVLYGWDLALERLLAVFKIEVSSWAPKQTSSRAFSPTTAWGVLLALAIPLAAIAAAMPRWPDRVPPTRSLKALVSEGLEPWDSEAVPTEYGFRGSTRFQQVVDRRYDVDGESVRVFLGTAALGQRGGSPLSPITALPGSGWRVLESSVLDASQDELIEERLVGKGKERRLLRHWVVGDRGLAEESWRSLLALDRSPLRRQEPFYVVRLETPLAGRTEEQRLLAAARLDRLAVRLEPVFENLAMPPHVDRRLD